MDALIRELETLRNREDVPNTRIVGAVIATGNEQTGGGRVQDLPDLLFGGRGRGRRELADQPAQCGDEVRIGRCDLLDPHG